MKYMQNGGFQRHPLMQLTLSLALIFLVAFVISNFLLYFQKMDLTPGSIVTYYKGSEEAFRPARSYQSMLEVTHMHLPMMALVLLLLTHLVIFAPFSKGTKISLILITFLSGLFNEAGGWLVLYVHEGFAWLKVFSFLTLQGSLVFLVTSLGLYLWHWLPAKKENGKELDSTEVYAQHFASFKQSEESKMGSSTGEEETQRRPREIQKELRLKTESDNTLSKSDLPLSP